MNFRLTSVAAPKAALSSTSRYSRTAILTAGIGLDEATVDRASRARLACRQVRRRVRKAGAAHQSLGHAAAHHRLEDMTQSIAVTETAMAVLRDAVIGRRPWQP